ncbi:MAG: competence/damage-inducible protein A [Gammaproteobacteria bacterium]
MKIPRIGFLIIGDEILSGRTGEKNLPVLAELLDAKGLQIREARVAGDSPPVIAAALNEMRAAHEYIFTSGGIGPTHDDVTAEGIALAFGVAVEENAEAAAILADFYARRDLEFTAPRRRMARAPAGAAILKSDFPGAPGFIVGNVFVCAGVPAIFRLMAAAAVAGLPDFPRRSALTLRADGAESEMADALAAIQRRHAALKIGSYPREENGAYYCHFVFSGADAREIAAAAGEMSDFLAEQGIPCREIS